VKHLSRFLSLLSLCFGVQLGVMAQTSRGTVTGLVTDPQKAVVANATVELTGNATNVIRRTQTNDAGIFRFDAVDPGDYRLEIMLTGFKTFAANQLTVGAAQVITQDAQMEIGAVSDTVTVVEGAVQLRVDFNIGSPCLRYGPSTWSATATPMP